MIAPELGFITADKAIPLAIPILVFLLFLTMFKRTHHPEGSVANVSGGTSALFGNGSRDLTFDPAGRERLSQEVSAGEQTLRGELVSSSAETELIKKMAEAFDLAAAAFAKAEKEGFIDEGQRLVFNNDFTGFIFRVKEAELHFRNLEAGEILFLKQYKLIFTDVEKHPKVGKVRNIINEMNQQEQIIITKTIEVKKLVLEIDVEAKNESFIAYLEAIKNIHTFPVALSNLISESNTLKQYLDALIPFLKLIGEKNSGLIARAIKTQKEVTDAIGRIYQLLEKVRRKLS